MRSIVIIPTYNERERVGPLVSAVLMADTALDILVVDDIWADGSGAIADGSVRHSDRERVRHRPGEVGPGAAYLVGFAYALSRDYRCIREMDAGFSPDPADLPRLLAPVRAGAADLAAGSRRAPGGRTRGWPAHRRIIGLGGPVRELTGGCNCCPRRALEQLDLGAVRASDHGFRGELTYRALHTGSRVLEVSIGCTERRCGRVGMSGRIVAEAPAVVWRLRFGRPTPRVAGEVAR
ncbi:MAG TPA: glycosyltransferase [Thermomicrobiales bacterium]|jgi:dolichol-phosphate mannosyltransferase